MRWRVEIAYLPGAYWPGVAMENPSTHATSQKLSFNFFENLRYIYLRILHTETPWSATGDTTEAVDPRSGRSWAGRESYPPAPATPAPWHVFNEQTASAAPPGLARVAGGARRPLAPDLDV